jgi:hypothetical protein
MKTEFTRGEVLSGSLRARARMLLISAIERLLVIVNLLFPNEAGPKGSCRERNFSNVSKTLVTKTNKYMGGGGCVLVCFEFVFVFGIR